VRLLRHRTVQFVAAVSVVWAASQAFAFLTAPGRIDGALRERLDREPRVNVAITLGFAPEDFHVRLFQEYGVVSGVRGTTVLLSRVRSDDVRRIARYYWVRRITAQ
jgi:hypothetical protein